MTDVVEVDDVDDLYRHLRPTGHVRKNKTVAPTAFMTRLREAEEKRYVPDSHVSVDLARLTTLEETLPPSRREGGWGVGQLRAAVPRKHGLDVKHEPETGNWAHSLILGMRPQDEDMALCEILAQNTVILRLPTPPPPSKPPQ